MTATAAAAAMPMPPFGRATRNSGTRRRLRLVLAALVLGTAVVSAGATSAFVSAHAAIDRVNRLVVPTVRLLVSSEQTLADANRAAMRDIADSSPDAYVLSDGPYGNALAVGQQDLARVAQLGLVNGSGTLVEKLVIYTDLLQQARLSYVQGSADLGEVQAWYASYEMEGPGGVILSLADMTRSVLATADADLATARENAVLATVWAGGALAVGIAIGWSMVWFRRRFNRNLNYGLIPAALCLAGLTGCIGLAIAPTYDIGPVVRALDQQTSSWEQGLVTRSPQIDQPVSADGSTGLLGGVDDWCRRSTACLATLDGAVDGAAADHDLPDFSALSDRAEAAADGHALEYWIPGAGVGVVAFLVLGFGLRLYQYRYPTR